MKGVNFYGKIDELTGYGMATKSFALSFSLSDVQTSFKIPVTNSNKNFLLSLKNSNSDGDIDFYLSIPPWNLQKNNNYKIAYFYWETDTLPAQWKNQINKANELWVPTVFQKNLVLKSGFRGKVSVIPTPAIPRDFSKKASFITKTDREIFSEEYFKFYSIFQWHDRKGYRELIYSYLRAFKPDDKVCLVIKTNPIDGANFSNIIKDIKAIKYSTRLKYFPKIFLIADPIREEYISALHSACQVYVSPHHGEGWGMSLHDAMLAKKLIISTKYGGISEWLDETNSLLLKHYEGPISGMQWNNLYSRSHNWAHPSIVSVEQQMKNAYFNYSKLEELGNNAFELGKNFTAEEVSKYISDRIRTI